LCNCRNVAGQLAVVSALIASAQAVEALAVLLVQARQEVVGQQGDVFAPLDSGGSRSDTTLSR